jgi:hypothetical protein
MKKCFSRRYWAIFHRSEVPLIPVVWAASGCRATSTTPWALSSVRCSACRPASRRWTCHRPTSTRAPTTWRRCYERHKRTRPDRLGRRALGLLGALHEPWQRSPRRRRGTSQRGRPAVASAEARLAHARGQCVADLSTTSINKDDASMMLDIKAWEMHQSIWIGVLLL